jgi:hypothetical protein
MGGLNQVGAHENHRSRTWHNALLDTLRETPMQFQ